MANIGDLNGDAYSQRSPPPEEQGLSGYRSLPDLIIGCPQGRTGFDGGKMVLGFLQGSKKKQAATGEIEAYR